MVSFLYCIIVSTLAMFAISTIFLFATIGRFGDDIPAGFRMFSAETKRPSVVMGPPVVIPPKSDADSKKVPTFIYEPMTTETTWMPTIRPEEYQYVTTSPELAGIQTQMLRPAHFKTIARKPHSAKPTVAETTAEPSTEELRIFETTTTKKPTTTTTTTKTTTTQIANQPKQLIVLAMHHSGTSLLTRIIMEMGAYGGQRDEFKLMKSKARDPAKFWERKDIIGLNELLVKTNFARDPGWVTGYTFKASDVNDADARTFSVGMRFILDDMRQAASSARQALVIKEPRLSLTYPFWHDVVDRSAVCVLIYRHPYLVATGLRKRPRNRGMLLDEWLALWEKYTVGTFKACAHRRAVFVSHHGLATRPLATVEQLYHDLRALGVALKPINGTWLEHFLPAHTAPALEPAFDRALSAFQRELWSHLQSHTLPPLSSAAPEREDALSERESGDVVPERADDAPTSSKSHASSLDEALQAAAFGAQKRDVVVVPSNTFFADLARNQVCSIRRIANANITPLVLGLDDHFCDAMTGTKGTLCYYDKDFGVGVADHQRWTLNRESQYFHILQLKMAYVERIVAQEFNVLLADADIVWRENAFEALSKQALDANVDLLIQSDARRNVEGKRDWICAGFFYMRSNARTALFMQTTREIMSEFGAPDQDVWQLLLRGSGQNFGFPDDWRQKRPEGGVWQSADEMGLRWAVLDEDKYANGGRYFGSKHHREKAVIVHANMRGFPKKVLAFQNHDMWFLDQFDVDICQLAQ